MPKSLADGELGNRRKGRKRTPDLYRLLCSCTVLYPLFIPSLNCLLPAGAEIPIFPNSVIPLLPTFLHPAICVCPAHFVAPILVDDDDDVDAILAAVGLRIPFSARLKLAISRWLGIHGRGEVMDADVEVEKAEFCKSSRSDNHDIWSSTEL